MPTIYFAHFMGDYDTPRETKALETLRQALPDYEIVNPNTPERAHDFQQWRDITQTDDPMAFWRKLVRECDALAYLPMEGTANDISAGVAAEMLEAQVWGKDIWKIEPGYVRSGNITNVLTIEETRERLVGSKAAE